MPARKRALPEDPCPIARAVDAVGDRWTLHILKHANVGLTRFEQFKTELGIADNILSARLTRLVERGLLVRTPYVDAGRTRQEYRLTQAGADLLPVMHALAAWGESHTSGTDQVGPIEFVHTDCGTPLGIDNRCDTCGRLVAREEESWVRPWRKPVVTPVAPPLEVAG